MTLPDGEISSSVNLSESADNSSASSVAQPVYERSSSPGTSSTESTSITHNPAGLDTMPKNQSNEDKGENNSENHSPMKASTMNTDLDEPNSITPSEISHSQNNEKINSSEFMETPDKTLNSPPLAPVPSPRKSPNSGISLPKISSGSLQVLKRRRLEPSTPNGDGLQDQLLPIHSHHITPSKNRSFSSPVSASFQQSRRTPSLQDKPIPVLSPPSPSNSIRSISSSSSSTFVSPCASFKTPISESRSGHGLLSIPSSDSLNESSKESDNLSHSISISKHHDHHYHNHNHSINTPSSTITDTPLSTSTTASTPSSSSYSAPSSALHIPKRVKSIHRISPLASRSRGGKNSELSKSEMELDREIIKWKKLIDTAQQAKKYQTSNEDEKLHELADQWLDVAQKGASYLYNEAKLRVDRMGGMEEFLKRKKEDEESRKQMTQFGNDEDFDLDKLSPEEREQYEILKSEYEEEMRLNAKINGETEADPTDFTMKYMLKSLNVNYKQVFPDGFDTDDE